MQVSQACLRWTKQAMVFSRLKELDIFPIDGIFNLQWVIGL